MTYRPTVLHERYVRVMAHDDESERHLDMIFTAQHLIAEVKRLKGLVESVHPGQLLDECPWCNFKKNRHDRFCQGFTPTGRVK